MSKVQMVRALVEQRLTAAAEEIFGLFEKTIAEYEEELCRSREENERQQKLLDAVWKPEVRIHRADIKQLLEVKDGAPPEQQEWSPSLDQGDPPEPSHIKEEQEELWTNQAGEQFEGLDELDITKLLFTPVLLKSGDDGEKPQSSQLHQRQTEQMETGADGEDWGGPQPDRNLGPDIHLQPETEDNNEDVFETEDSFDSEQTGELQSGSNFLKNNKVSKRVLKCDTQRNPLKCLVCGKVFKIKGNLIVHVRTHTGEKPFVCSVCGKRFKLKAHLTGHLRTHTGEKPFSCSFCGKRCAVKGNLKKHEALHTGEKRFVCSICDQTFTWGYQLTKHKLVCPQSSQCLQQQTQESREAEPAKNSHPDTHLNPEMEVELEDYSETEDSLDDCPKTRELQSGLNPTKNNETSKRGTRDNTGENRFMCVVCGKGFNLKGTLNTHMVIHTDEKPFSCSVCGKKFKLKGHLTAHLRIHTGEKPFSCSSCGNRYADKGNLKKHMALHTGEKRLTCDICDQRFTWAYQLRKHKPVCLEFTQRYQNKPQQNRGHSKDQ